jgi:hypothetical protein
MWDVDPTFDLPEGFALKENTHFVYLFYHGQKVRVFNANRVTSTEILKACAELADEEI